MTSSIGIGDADRIALRAKWRRPHYSAVTGGLIIGNRLRCRGVRQLFSCLAGAVCASVAARNASELSSGSR
jgi:hypothetical protein